MSNEWADQFHDWLADHEEGLLIEYMEKNNIMNKEAVDLKEFDQWSWDKYERLSRLPIRFREE